MATQRRGRREQ